jgi:hypothetical protein
MTVPLQVDTAGVASPVRRGGALRSPLPVLLCGLLATAAFGADAALGEANLELAGFALMALSLALALAQAQWAHVGSPWRMSRLAAATGTAASLFVAAFLSSVGVLERMGPQVTNSAVFGAGVAGMSVIFLIVLPVALVVFSWGVFQDRRLSGWLRRLPWAIVVVVVLEALAVAGTEGSGQLWLQVAATGVAVGVAHRLQCRSLARRAPGAA